MCAPIIANLEKILEKMLMGIFKIIILTILFLNSDASASRFTSRYPCKDTPRICEDRGIKIFDNVYVHPKCSSFGYSKTCAYPSVNDCMKYDCYFVANRQCLLFDNYGACVNQKKEISCKSWNPVTFDRETVRTSLVEKDGQEQLVCEGIPCIDGNCVDKSYVTDGDMMESVSKLYAVSQTKGAKDLNFRLFGGFAESCSKKATSYTNCCSTDLDGWGNRLGARCTKDEKDLLEKRKKNLCVYVGKQNKQTMGVNVVVKHHYCCFSSMLDKVIQVEGRKKQLGINFGSPGYSDCKGLTLAEIMRLDFNKMDFSAFYSDVLKRMKLPKVDDISARVNSSLPKINTYDNDPNNKNNNMSGWNENGLK